ncbi:MAG: DUF45 domain-containing protein [Clostridia bacterium]|nr:DUF45 domain-containing protein [Clostridia bacterium]
MKAGPYEVIVTARANCRRMILRCSKADGRLTLSVPKGTPQRVIREFLLSQMEWIERQAGVPRTWKAVYAPGEQHYLLGRLVTLGKEVPSGDAFLARREAELQAVVMRLLQKWCGPMGVRVTHVTFRQMTSRWGSCRPQTGRLTFNLRLGLYEEALIEETVVHELCHFFHADHSAAFYREMSRWLPDWQARKTARNRRDVRPRPPQ